MQVLMLAINDPAGTAIQFCKALRRHADVDARLCTLETRYTHSWEKDLHVPDLGPEGIAELGGLLRTADILHFHMTSDEFTAFGPYLPADFLAGKTVVHHHHGHHDFRSNPEKFRAKYRERGRTNLLVSTPDLLRLLPEARWLPNLVPLDESLLRPDPDRPERPFRLCHSPTRKDLKNTDELLAVLERLRADGLDLDFDLIDDVPNAECLRRKRVCHAVFDHMQGYYGVSSLEGLSQGLAVIAGLDDWCRGHVADFAGTDDLPWVVAHDGVELEAALRRLAVDPELRRELGRKGREFMEQRWSDRLVARRLADWYGRL